MVGDRGLSQGVVEYQNRRVQEKIEVPLSQLIEFMQGKIVLNP